MRKHPLIALTAFTALTASAAAGASTGTFQTSSTLTGARTRPSVATLATPTADLTYGDVLAYQLPRRARDLAVAHDPGRPVGIRISNVTGLPIAHRHRHHHARHRTAALIHTVTAPAASATASPVTTVTTPAPPPAAPAGGVWYELRMCESGGNYAEDTGNGYYGAYQFSLSTWYGLGFSGLPSDAAPAVQDRAAEQLQAEYGWGQWPGCAAELGL